MTKNNSNAGYVECYNCFSNTHLHERDHLSGGTEIRMTYKKDKHNYSCELKNTHSSEMKWEKSPDKTRIYENNLPDSCWATWAKQVLVNYRQCFVLPLKLKRLCSPAGQSLWWPTPLKAPFPLVFGLVGAVSGRGVWCRQGHSLLVHPLGLRAHDETEEVLIWYGGPSRRGRGRSAALVIQTGALKDNTTVWLWILKQTVSILFCSGYLALDEHVEEVIVGFGAVGVGHQVAEHRLVTALIEPEAWQASSCCWRLLYPPALGHRHVYRLWHGYRERTEFSTGRLCTQRKHMHVHFLMALGGDPGPLFNDNLLPLFWTEQRWSSMRLLWKRLSRSKKPSSPSMSGLRRWHKTQKQQRD